MAHESIAATIGDHQFVQQLSKPNSGNKIERDFSFPQHFHGKLCASSTWRKNPRRVTCHRFASLPSAHGLLRGGSQVARFLSRAENSFETGNNFSLFSRAFKVHCVCVQRKALITRWFTTLHCLLLRWEKPAWSGRWCLQVVRSVGRKKPPPESSHPGYFFLLAITSARKGEPTLNQKGKSPLMLSEVGVWWSVACCDWEWRWRQTDTKGKQF